MGWMVVEPGCDADSPFSTSETVFGPPVVSLSWEEGLGGAGRDLCAVTGTVVERVRVVTVAGIVVVARISPPCTPSCSGRLLEVVVWMGMVERPNWVMLAAGL